MKQSAEAYKIFLAVYIVTCLLLFPAYAHFYDLTEADVFRGVHVENHALGDHLTNLEKKWEGFGVADHFQVFFENSNFNLCPVRSLALSYSKDYSPLRC